MLKMARPRENILQPQQRPKNDSQLHKESQTAYKSPSIEFLANSDMNVSRVRLCDRKKLIDLLQKNIPATQ